MEEIQVEIKQMNAPEEEELYRTLAVLPDDALVLLKTGALTQKDVSAALTLIRHNLAAQNGEGFDLSAQAVEMAKTKTGGAFMKFHRRQSWLYAVLEYMRHVYVRMDIKDICAMYNLRRGKPMKVKDFDKAFEELPQTVKARFVRLADALITSEAAEYETIVSHVQSLHSLTLPGMQDIEDVHAYGYPHSEPAYRQLLKAFRNHVSDVKAQTLMRGAFDRLTIDEDLRAGFDGLVFSLSLEDEDKESLFTHYEQACKATRRYALRGGKEK